tara:strand:- start:212 stop:568 length:357 start_codon:yes stop_codon:yes gene_type:complete
METKKDNNEYLESRKLSDTDQAWLNERRANYRHALQIVIQYLDFTNNSDTDLRYFVDRVLNHHEKSDQCSYKISNRFSEGEESGNIVYDRIGYIDSLSKLKKTEFDYNRKQYKFWSSR